MPICWQGGYRSCARTKSTWCALRRKWCTCAPSSGTRVPQPRCLPLHAHPLKDQPGRRCSECLPLFPAVLLYLLEESSEDLVAVDFAQRTALGEDNTVVLTARHSI